MYNNTVNVKIKCICTRRVTTSTFFMQLIQLWLSNVVINYKRGHHFNEYSWEFALTRPGSGCMSSQREVEKEKWWPSSAPLLDLNIDIVFTSACM